MTATRFMAIVTVFLTFGGCANTPKSTIPEFQNTENLKIELSRSSCYGPCPQYDLAIFGNGKVEFCGGVYVEKHGSHQGSLPISKVKDLYVKIVGLGFDELETDSEYNKNAQHVRTNIVTVSNGSYKKTIHERTSWLEDRRPIHKIHSAIDEVANSDQWIGDRYMDFPDLSPSPMPDCLKPYIE